MVRESWLYPTALCLCALWSVSGHVAGLNRTEEARRLFRVGQARHYEVVTPNPGYPGGAPWPGAFPSRREREQHRYLRVEVIDERVLPKKVTIVLRVDEVTKAGALRRKGLHFSYLDVYARGAVAVDKLRDDGKDYRETGFRHDLASPLTAAVPPQLNAGSPMSPNGYFFLGRGGGPHGWQPIGVAYSEWRPVPRSSAVEIGATAFTIGRELPAAADPIVLWYDSEIESLLKDSERCTTVWRETQHWKSGNDWLWTEMERRRPDGVLMMRCTEIEMPKEP